MIFYTLQTFISIIIHNFFILNDIIGSILEQYSIYLTLLYNFQGNNFKKKKLCIDYVSEYGKQYQPLPIRATMT